MRNRQQPRLPQRQTEARPIGEAMRPRDPPSQILPRGSRLGPKAAATTGAQDDGLARAVGPETLRGRGRDPRARKPVGRRASLSQASAFAAEPEGSEALLGTWRQFDGRAG